MTFYNLFNLSPQLPKLAFSSVKEFTADSGPLLKPRGLHAF